jgi:F-type H+-transporting ATPase subunit a
MVLVHPAVGVVSVPMALFIDLLEVLVAVIQAIVFTMLTAIFIGMASTSHEESDHSPGWQTTGSQ